VVAVLLKKKVGFLAKPLAMDWDQDGDLDVLIGLATSPSSSEMKTERSGTSSGRRTRACSRERGPATPSGEGVGGLARPSAGDQDGDLDALIGDTSRGLVQRCRAKRDDSTEDAEGEDAEPHARGM
jgi:hypothetical protein